MYITPVFLTPVNDLETLSAESTDFGLRAGLKLSVGL